VSIYYLQFIAMMDLQQTIVIYFDSKL